MYTIKEKFFEIDFVRNLQHLEKVIPKHNNFNRGYSNLIDCIQTIASYNESYANKFVKRFITEQNDINNCNAIYAEVIVIASFIQRYDNKEFENIRIEDDECDLITIDNNGDIRYYEILSIRPKIEISKRDKIIVNSINTHTQDKYSSIRVKILNKIRKQKQLIGSHKYSVVIELNHPLVASDFMVLSSLSEGYKIALDDSNKVKSEGYDLRTTIFDNEETRQIYSIIYFFQGDFIERRELLNPNFLGG